MPIISDVNGLSISSLKRYLIDRDEPNDAVEQMDEISLRCEVAKKMKVESLHLGLNVEAASGAMDLRDFIIVNEVQTKEGCGAKSFPSIKCMVKSVEGLHTVMRHEESLGGCKGMVTNGLCARCNMTDIMPVCMFQTRLKVCDLNDPSITMDLYSFKALAKSLYGTDNATEVRTHGIISSIAKLIMYLSRAYTMYMLQRTQ